jgi:SAM-dependent methyltransferase
MSEAPNLRPDAFAGTAEAYARWRPPYPRALLDALLREAGIGPGAQLLDLATGPGRLALDLAGAFAEVWAQDQEPEMIAAARAAAERRGVGNVIWSVGPAEAFEAPAGSFDLVTIGEAFHRVDQPVIARKARAWLKPAGCFATLGARAVLDGEHPWLAAATEVRRRWTARVFPDGPAVARAGIEPGPEAAIRVVENAGFTLVADRAQGVAHAWSFEGLLGFMHSTSVASKKVLGDNADAFADDL